MEGRKSDNDKLRYDLIPVFALQETVRVLNYGAHKYGPDNWRKVPDLRRRYVAAAMRHIEAYRMGERNDPESALAHLAHACSSLMFILEDHLNPEPTDVDLFNSQPNRY